MNKRRLPLILVGGAIVLFLLIQLIPFGHVRTNPPVLSEPNWSSTQARALVKEHCFQCHSNETNWTWYANIAPGSWLIAFDVVEGRQKFNFSDWKRKPGELDEMIGTIQEGEMPPIQYRIFHPNSKLDTTQKQELVDALTNTLQ
jgi:mono/diheme cytochrome c family protein